MFKCWSDNDDYGGQDWPLAPHDDGSEQQQGEGFVRPPRSWSSPARKTEVPLLWTPPWVWDDLYTFAVSGVPEHSTTDLNDGQFSERCDVDGSFFNSDAIPIIFGERVTSPSLRLFSLTIGNDYFSVSLLIFGPIILGLFTDWLGSSERKLY